MATTPRPGRREAGPAARDGGCRIQRPAGTRDLERAAELLARAWGAPVRVATLSGLGSRPEQVVRPGDCVSSYLLADGFFADRASLLAREAGASVVAGVLGPHELVVELVVRRTLALRSIELPRAEQLERTIPPLPDHRARTSTICPSGAGRRRHRLRLARPRSIGCSEHRGTAGQWWGGARRHRRTPEHP